MYFVFEIQELENGTYAALTHHDDAWTYAQAESVFHGKCQFAAISTIPTHTIILADADGAVYKTGTWKRKAPTA